MIITLANGMKLNIKQQNKIIKACKENEDYGVAKQLKNGELWGHTEIAELAEDLKEEGVL